jgi:cation transporter-like permease
MDHKEIDLKFVKINNNTSSEWKFSIIFSLVTFLFVFFYHYIKIAELSWNIFNKTFAVSSLVIISITLLLRPLYTKKLIPLFYFRLKRPLGIFSGIFAFFHIYIILFPLAYKFNQIQQNRFLDYSGVTLAYIFFLLLLASYNKYIHLFSGEYWQIIGSFPFYIVLIGLYHFTSYDKLIKWVKWIRNPFTSLPSTLFLLFVFIFFVLSVRYYLLVILKPSSSQKIEIPVKCSCGKTAKNDDTLLAEDKADSVISPVVLKKNHLLGKIEKEEMESVVNQSFNRIPWLLSAFVAGIVTAGIVMLSKDLIRKYEELAAFYPVVIALGENIGIQSYSLALEEIFDKEVSWENFWVFTLHQIRVGFTMGTIIGFVISIVIYLWTKKIFLTLSISLSMVLTSCFAAFFGCFFPYAMKKIKKDPAISSGPILSASAHATGAMVYFLMAWLIISFMKTLG